MVNICKYLPGHGNQPQGDLHSRFFLRFALSIAFSGSNHCSGTWSASWQKQGCSTPYPCKIFQPCSGLFQLPCSGKADAICVRIFALVLGCLGRVIGYNYNTLSQKNCRCEGTSQAERQSQMLLRLPHTAQLTYDPATSLVGNVQDRLSCQYAAWFIGICSSWIVTINIFDSIIPYEHQPKRVVPRSSQVAQQNKLISPLHFCNSLPGEQTICSARMYEHERSLI